MKNLVKVIMFLFICTAGVSNANAYSFLNDWQFDADGVGGVAAVTVGELFNTTGVTFVENTYIDANTFSFTETATFDSYSYLSPGYSTELWPFDGVLSASFTGSGFGTLGGGLGFTSGALTMTFTPTSAASYTIGEFSLIDGYAILDGQAVPNGIITTVFESTWLKADTWFDSAGMDLSTTVPLEWVLGFATTNATLVSNDNPPPYTAGDVQNLVISNNGQFRLAVVPEPSTFLLLGAGLVGLGFIARRRKQ